MINPNTSVIRNPDLQFTRQAL